MRRLGQKKWETKEAIVNGCLPGLQGERNSQKRKGRIGVELQRKRGKHWWDQWCSEHLILRKEAGAVWEMADGKNALRHSCKHKDLPQSY